MDQYRKLLEEFCDDVDAVGLVRNEHGYASPYGTEGWSDIGLTYMKACELLGRQPRWYHSETNVGAGTWEPQ